MATASKKELEKTSQKALQKDLRLILEAKHHDAFAYLGLHPDASQHVFRAFLPYADSVSLKIGSKWAECERTDAAGLYEWRGKLTSKTALSLPLLLKIESHGQTREVADTYSFTPILSDDELHLFGEGNLNQAYTSGIR